MTEYADLHFVLVGCHACDAADLCCRRAASAAPGHERLLARAMLATACRGRTQQPPAAVLISHMLNDFWCRTDLWCAGRQTSMGPQHLRVEVPGDIYLATYLSLRCVLSAGCKANQAS